MQESIQIPKFKCGLEVHGYLHVTQKLFCTCTIDSAAPPNTTICPCCTAQPGSKPMLPNADAITKVLKATLMLGCKVNHELIWQRKHYDWPDLPKGYQNTMSGSYAVPVGEHGNFAGIRIRECHLEEDPARWDPVTGLIDYNRSGYPLIEIVTEPDFADTSQVKSWLKKLITTLGYVKAINPVMGIKCDVNVSIPPNYARVEIKNVNSFSSIINAIEYEVQRQRTELHEGKKIEQQTRAWSDMDSMTKFMRSKEHALDYMFIPDPDLPIVEVTDKLLGSIEKSLPDKPEQKLRFLLKAGVEKTTADVIASDLPLSELFERLSKNINPLTVSNWIRKDLLRLMNATDKSLDELNLKDQHLFELLELLEEEKITEQVARTILQHLAQKTFSPKVYVKEQGISAISTSSDLENLCKKTIENNPKPVADYKSGKSESLNYLVGQVMRATKGTAKPQELKDIFIMLLK